MSWLARIAGSAGARLAVVAAAAAAIAGALLFFLARAFRAGGDAERARSAEAARDHERQTETQTRKADDAIADPGSARARRVRRMFQRTDPTST